MSELEKLIQELCPNGVAHKKLREVATISRGGNFQKKDYVEAEDTREVIDITVLNAQIEEIVARENVLREEISKIIAEIEVQ